MSKMWFLCAAFTLWSWNPALAVNTHKGWDGSDSIYGFGCPDTSTYGQLVTAPRTQHTLGQFSFWWVYGITRGSMVVRAEVYAWDGSKATGNALYESEPRTISFQKNRWHKETFMTGGVPVARGEKYVLFASIDKDYEECTPNNLLSWGAVINTYKRGRFVYQNNRGNEAAWTTKPWNNWIADDLVIKTSQ